MYDFFTRVVFAVFLMKGREVILQFVDGPAVLVNITGEGEISTVIISFDIPVFETGRE